MPEILRPPARPVLVNMLELVLALFDERIEEMEPMDMMFS
jgi:hypothetical protein